MKNEKIRDALNTAGMKQWELADLLEVSEGTLSRKLRYELPEEEQSKIVSVIQRAANGKSADQVTANPAA